PRARRAPTPAPTTTTAPTTPTANITARTGHATPRPRVDWGDAFAIPAFYGREWEQAMLTQWVVEERCRVVSVLGLGGIGKSALAVHVMHRLAEHFEVVIFRSLRDAPSCEALLEACVQVLSPELLAQIRRAHV